MRSAALHLAEGFPSCTRSGSPSITSTRKRYSFTSSLPLGNSKILLNTRVLRSLAVERGAADAQEVRGGAVSIGVSSPQDGALLDFAERQNIVVLPRRTAGDVSVRNWRRGWLIVK